MKTLLKNLLLAFPTLLFFQCSSDDPNLTTDVIKAIIILDVENNQNASDLLVNFNLDDPSMAEELRIMIIPANESGDFTAKKAKDVPAESYHSITVSGNIYQVQLPENLTDVNGDGIVENKTYSVAVGLMKGGNLFLNENFGTITLTNQHPLTGRYTGLWTDNIYLDFGISCELIFQAGKLRGDFFYSANFQPCCGGDNDGSITLDVQNGIIEEFKYNQTLDLFMGGPCPGLYTGTGVVTDAITMKIDFAGDDCEGEHTGGKIILTRIN